MKVINAEKKKLIEKLCQTTLGNNLIDPEYYERYQVKKGFRDINGIGVLAGLTRIGEVIGHDLIDGERRSIPGRLLYRGYDVEDLSAHFTAENRFGFEETIFLLLFGYLPDRSEMNDLYSLLADYRTLPEEFVKKNIMMLPSPDVMNALSRAVLGLYSFDSNADDITVSNVLRQSMQLISCFPMLAVYSYQAYLHYYCHKSLTIHNPLPERSTAENLLYMMRPSSSYTDLEAKLLDLTLVLHAEHGGGTNSSFITHIETSSATDTYSVISAALGSLKGVKHGGADSKVIHMMEDLKSHLQDWEEEKSIEKYLSDILDQKAFDGTGTIYGMGHAVYSISDPRAELLKKHLRRLAVEKGEEAEYALYCRVDELAKKVIAEKRKIYKGVCANVDFYSGLVYKMLAIPQELFAPLFAVSRIAGWSAHRIEELVNDGKIIRPAYQSIASHRKYVSLDERVTNAQSKYNEF